MRFQAPLGQHPHIHRCTHTPAYMHTHTQRCSHSYIHTHIYTPTHHLLTYMQHKDTYSLTHTFIVNTHKYTRFYTLIKHTCAHLHSTLFLSSKDPELSLLDSRDLECPGESMETHRKPISSFLPTLALLCYIPPPATSALRLWTTPLKGNL